MDQNQNVRLEGKSSPWKWLIPLLILLVVLGILYALLKSNTNNTNNEQNTPTSTSTESTSTPESQETMPITSIADIYTVTDISAINGLQVDIKNAPVQRVTGDRTFFIGNKGSTTQQVLVYSPTRMKVGDIRDIMGTIKPLPSIKELQSTWKVTANELNALKNVKVYIDATSVATSSLMQ